METDQGPANEKWLADSVPVIGLDPVATCILPHKRLANWSTDVLILYALTVRDNSTGQIG